MKAPRYPRSNWRGRLARREGGFILVWVGLIMTVLLGFAGMAVDLGNWYLNIQRIQRAADAAALAGDPYMPAYYEDNNTDGLNAREVARRALIENGMTTAQANAAYASKDCSRPACIAMVPDHPTQLQVKVQTTVRNTFFRMFNLGATQSFNRGAIADYTPELHISSESNLLGGPEPNDGSGLWGPVTTWGNRNYWLQMGGVNTSKTEGDRLNSYDCTPNSFGAYAPDRCSGGRNDEFTETKGYLFAIDVKATNSGPARQYLEMQMYDGQMTMEYDPSICPPGDLHAPTCPADELYGETDVNRLTGTRFAFYDSPEFHRTETPPLWTCPYISPRTGPVVPRWENVCLNNMEHQRIEVNMRTGARLYMRVYTAPGVGTNHYMLRAGLFNSATGGTVNRTLSYSNVELSAWEHMPIYNEIDGPGATGANSTFVIGQINSEWAGRTIHFQFWAVGDATDGVSPVDGALFLEGNRTKVDDALVGNCRYTRPNNSGNETDLVYAPYRGCGFTVTRAQYNGKLVMFEWDVPSSYRCAITEDCTLKVSMDMNGEVVDDTTTSVVEAGKPLRLIK